MHSLGTVLPKMWPYLRMNHDITANADSVPTSADQVGVKTRLHALSKRGGREGAKKEYPSHHISRATNQHCCDHFPGLRLCWSHLMSEQLSKAVEILGHHRVVRSVRLLVDRQGSLMQGTRPAIHVLSSIS